MRFTVYIILLCCAFNLNAQSNLGESKEIGYQIGTSYYIGDLNPDNPLGCRYHLAQGGYYRYNINSRIGVRFQILQGTIEAWDEDRKNPWSVNRYSITGEINYIDHVLGNPENRITGFLSAGLAYYSHDPESMDSFGNWHPLQPMGTEGQGWIEGIDVYKLSGVALPYGMGFKMNLGTLMSFQMEWGMRKTWTDYLDDVSTSYVDNDVLRIERGELSAELADRIIELPEGMDSSAGMQRGDPGRNDKYGYVLASIAFRVSKKLTSCWAH